MGLPAVLAVVPPVLLIRAVGRDTVDFPWMDQWTFARDVVLAHDGQLTAASFWVQHNEHRVPVTKVVLHLLAALSDWDTRWEVAATVTVALAAILILTWMILRTVGPIAPHAVGVLILVASAVQSSLAQWQNWTWGWQLGLLLAQAAAVVVAAALVRLPAAPARWSIVVVLAAVAGALSNGAGLVLLVAAPLGLIGLRLAGVPMPARRLLGAVAMCSATAVLYAVGWRPAMGQPPPTPIPGHVTQLLHFALTFLGGPIASWDVGPAWRWGVTGAAVVVICAVRVWVSAPPWRRAIVPWLVLAAFSGGAAAMTAVGRLGVGMHVALLSRYTTFAVPLWFAAGPLVAIAIGSVPQRTVRLGLTCVAGALLALAVYEGAFTWERGNERMAARASIARLAAACIAAPQRAPDGCYRAVCWNAAWARQGALQHCCWPSCRT